MPDQKEKHPIGPHLGHAILSKLRRFGFGEESFLIVLAVLIGCLTSLGSIVFIELVYYIHGLCYGQGESEGLYRGAWFMLLLLPMLGALFVGFITFFYSEEVRGHGVSEVMCAIARRNGVIRARVALAKAVASALTIGSGGSAGTEGPIIQIGSAIGSSVGQRFRAVRYNMPVLVGCGAAAGIASIFNAPIAGVLFAREVFLRDVSFRTFSPVLVSAVISSVMTRGLLGKHDVMFPLVSDIEYIFHWYELGNYVVLGVITALIGVVFIKALYATDDLFGRLRVHNILKPVIGAMLLGVTGIAIAYLSGGGVPVIFGQGYSFIGRCIGGSSDAVASYFVSSIWMLALVVALKIVATCLTLGSGGSGGAFAPSLFIGAATGYAFGMAMEMTGLFPTIHLQTYAIVGMAAVVAATNHAVLAATVIVFELTRNYNIILPAMFASTISVAGVKFLIRDSIHTMKLRREGINFASRAGRAILQRLTVAKVMHREFSVVRDSMSLNDVISKAESTELSDFIVVDAQNRYLGMLLAKNLHEVLVHRESAALLLVSEVVDTSIPPVTLDETLDTVFDKFSLHNSDTMPVLTQENSTTFAGMVTRAAVMKSQQEEMDSAA